MTLSVTHSTVVVIPDDGISPVGTNEWNAAHTVADTSTIEYYGADPSASAATNAAAIQAAFDVGGRLTLTKPGVYLVNAVLKIGSNTDLYVGPGVTIRRMVVDVNLLETKASSVSTASVSLSRSGFVITATWATHGLAIGDVVCIEAANQSYYNGCFVVLTVPTASTFTYQVERLPGAPAAPSGTILGRVANKNITITGGSWDHNYPTFAAVPLGSAAIKIGFAYNVQIRDVTCLNCYAFGVQAGAVRAFRAENLKGIGGREPLKVYGPAYGVIANGIHGFAGTDDVCSVHCREDPAVFAAWQWTRGDCLNVRIGNVHAIGASVGSLVAVYCSPDEWMDEIYVHDVHGGHTNQCCLILGHSGGGSLGGSIEFENIGGHAGLAVNVQIVMAERVRIANLVPNSESTTGAMVNVTADATVRELIIDGFSTPNSDWTPNASSLLSVYGTVDYITVKDFESRSSTDVRGVTLISGSTVKQVSFNNINLLDADFVILCNSGALGSPRIIFNGGYAKVNALLYTEIALDIVCNGMTWDDMSEGVFTAGATVATNISGIGNRLIAGNLTKTYAGSPTWVYQNFSYDIAATIGVPLSVQEITVPNTGLHLLDTNASHDLIVKPGSNITSDRTLTLTTGDTDMVVDVTATTDEYVLAYDTTNNTWRGVLGSSTIFYPAAWDPLAQANGGSAAVITGVSRNNRMLSGTTTTGGPVLGDKAKSTGKWYAEITVTSSAGGNNTAVGVGTSSTLLTNYLGKTAASWAWFVGYGFLYTADANGPAVSTIATGDVVGIAYDADTGKLWFAKNNVWQTSGVPSTGTSPAFTLSANTALYLAAGVITAEHISINQTQTYSPPTGFIAWDGNQQQNTLDRKVLKTNRAYYVRNGGSDSNDGLIDTDANAFLTIQHAYDEICKLDFGGIYTVTIKCKAGVTWGAGITTANAWTGAGALIIDGQVSTISTAVANCFWFQAGCVLPGGVEVRGFTLTTTGGTFQCLRLECIGTFYITTNMVFGAVTGSHIVAGLSSVVYMQTAYTISGNAVAHLAVSADGYIRTDGITVTMTGTPAFSTAFAYATGLGTVFSFGNTYGTTTGKRYLAEINGTINTAGGGANYFPGNVAGTTATGGQYI